MLVSVSVSLVVYFTYRHTKYKPLRATFIYYIFISMLDFL